LWHFVFVRGAEGLGETFYFPASMSLVSDYHSRETRSRAMSLHQTSVYAGTIGGSAFAGWMGQLYGWRVPFIILGVVGVILAFVLAKFLHEPRRGVMETGQDAEPIAWRTFLAEFVRTPSAVLLTLAFFGANAVAMVFLVWMPTFLKEKFGLNLAAAAFGGTVFLQTASMIGAAMGGMAADWLRMRHAGGRILTQAFGTLCGAPFILLCGSLYDVVPVSRRSSAVGIMNLIGWLGAGLGTWLIGRAANSGVTMSAAIGSTAAIYLGVACLLLFAGLVTVPRDSRRIMERHA
jgi:MFS family permease